MTAFPRTIGVEYASPFIMPGAMISFGDSGKSQRRSTIQTGRFWTEIIQKFKVSSPEGRQLLAFLNNCWRNGLVFDIEHYGYVTKNGGGTGSPVVAGAGQSGTGLQTQAWAGSNPVLKYGDIIRIAGISQVFDIVADAPNLVSGATGLTINPPIFVGGSPLDNAAISYGAAIRLNAILAAKPLLPSFNANEFIAGLTLSYAEVVS